MAGADDLRIRVSLDLAQAEADLARFKNGLEATVQVAGRAGAGVSGGIGSMLSGLNLGSFGPSAVGAASIAAAAKNVAPQIGGLAKGVGTASGYIAGMGEAAAEATATNNAIEQFKSDFGFVAGQMSPEQIRRVVEGNRQFSRMDAAGALATDRATASMTAQSALGSTITGFLQKAVDMLPDALFR